jgi:hypothetical protein
MCLGSAGFGSAGFGSAAAAAAAGGPAWLAVALRVGCGWCAPALCCGVRCFLVNSECCLATNYRQQHTFKDTMRASVILFSSRGV